MTIIQKFEPDKYEEKKINWRGRRISALIVFSVMALIVVEIWVSHTVANFGEKFKTIETVKKTLVSDNRFLENEIAEFSSIHYIASQSARLGFIAPKNIKYIR